MSLASELRYQPRPANPVQRVVQAFGASRPGAWLFSRILPPIDTLVQRLTRRRHTLPSLLAGLPVVDLTTTGRRSGRPRTTHLIAVPYGDALAVLGTNFGQPATPTWVLNLEAHPQARLSYRHRVVDVVARPLAGDEAEELLLRAERLYAGYRIYQGRITGRRLRIFALESAAGDRPA
jgi:deazaflavin-dependent oxidoreductase (nitroreductase family)